MAQLRALYARQNKVSSKDSFLLAKPLEEWQQTAAKTIIHWCHQVEKSLRKQKIIDANELLATQRPIYEYFIQMDSPAEEANDGISRGSEDSPKQMES